MNPDVGFRFPFGFASGRTATVGGTQAEQTNDDRDASVRGGAEQVLLTGRGERVMLCGFGAGLDRWLFGATPGTEGLIRQEAVESVERWSPRARVTTAAVSTDPQAGEVEVRLVVRHSDADAESVVRVAVRS